MKLLSVDIAQAWWYGPTRDLNPRGISWFSVISSCLVDLYKFKVLPDRKDKDKPEGLKFQDGEFNYVETDRPIAVNFSIYPGGVSAETGFSTNASDIFLADLFTKLHEEFKMPPFPEVIRLKRYISQLWVSTDKSLAVLNPKLQKIVDFLSKNGWGGGINFEVGGLSIWPDQTVKFPPPAFSIERAANIPFSENRYLSRAPLETDQHLALLDEIEEVLS